MWLFIDRRLIISCNPSNVPKELHWPWIITRKQNSSTSPCTFQTDDNRCAIFQIAPVPSPLTRRHSHELTCKKNIFPFLRAIFEHNHHIFSFFGSFCCFGKLFILRVIWNLSLVTHLRKRRRGGGNWPAEMWEWDKTVVSARPKSFHVRRLEMKPAFYFHFRQIIYSFTSEGDTFTHLSTFVVSSLDSDNYVDT